MTEADAGAGDWVNEAAELRVAFAQVREDALIDLAVLDRIGRRGLRGIMIASGGCTAAALAASGRVASLHLVDVNPAQIVLSRLKIHLLQSATPIDRARILGHAPMDAELRASRLAENLNFLGAATDVLGPPATVARFGIDHAGRYELLFARLRDEMGALTAQWPEILGLRDAGARSARVAPVALLGRLMDQAFDRVMDLQILVRLFGAAATQNSVQPFSRHFAMRTRHAIAEMETVDNPYLWQLLTGRFPASVASPWLNAPVCGKVPEMICSVSSMDNALGGFRDHFDFVYLSNILDWLTAEQAGRTLALACEALRPGGLVLIRQLNSTLRPSALGGPLQWLEDEANELHSRDRSFFYRFLHLGRKP